MKARRDPIAVVEACYDLQKSEREWLEAITVAMHRVLDGEHGVVGYHVQDLGIGLRITNAVQSSGELDVAGRLLGLNALLEQEGDERDELTRTVQAVFRGGMAEPADHLLMSEFTRHGPDSMYSLGVPGVIDQLTLKNEHIDGLGATFVVAGLARRQTLRCAERQLYQMLGAHIKAGLRLRRRLREPGPLAAPVAGAVLDGDGRVVHAEGDAASCVMRDALHAAALRMDRARCERGGRDADAVAVWEGLVDGRWSLVEQFDVDGKRFILAHQNPENVPDPRGLTDKECRVAQLSARGYSNKLVAYHLGICESAVSAHLAAALRKLRVSSRVELVRMLGAPEPRARFHH